MGLRCDIISPTNQILVRPVTAVMVKSLAIQLQGSYSLPTTFQPMRDRTKTYWFWIMVLSFRCLIKSASKGRKTTNYYIWILSNDNQKGVYCENKLFIETKKKLITDKIILEVCCSEIPAIVNQVSQTARKHKL